MSNTDYEMYKCPTCNYSTYVKKGAPMNKEAKCPICGAMLKP